MSNWDDLTLAEKSEMMRVAVQNGITNLSDIKAKYNEFALGGNIFDGVSRSTQKMNRKGKSKQTFLSSLDQSLKENNKFDSAEWRRFFTDLANMESGYQANVTNSIGAKGYFQLMPYNRAETWTNPTQQFHEMYKLTGNNLKTLNRLLTKKDREKAKELGIDMYGMLAGSHLGGVGNVLKALRGKGNAKDMNGTSVMKYMTKFSQGTHGVPVQRPAVLGLPFIPEQPSNTSIYNSYVPIVQNTQQLPIMVPDNTYVTTHEVSPEDQRQQKLREDFEKRANFNNFMKVLSVVNNPTPSYTPSTGNSFLDSIGLLANSSYANGGNLYGGGGNKPVTTGGAGYFPSMSDYTRKVIDKIGNISKAAAKAAGNYAKNIVTGTADAPRNAGLTYLRNLNKENQEEALDVILHSTRGGEVMSSDDMLEYGLPNYIRKLEGKPMFINYTGNNKQNKRDLVNLYLKNDTTGFEDVTDNPMYTHGADYKKYIKENYPDKSIKTYKMSSDGIPLRVTKEDYDRITETSLSKPTYVNGSWVEGGDNVGSMIRWYKNIDGKLYAVDSDIWDFNPKDWTWEGDDNKIVDKVGTPFILKALRPVEITDDIHALSPRNITPVKYKPSKSLGGPLEQAAYNYIR